VDEDEGALVGEDEGALVGEDEGALVGEDEVALMDAVLLAPFADEDVEVQLTAVGRPVTPEIPQNCCAKFVADCWSAASHFPARQHAMSLRKVPLEQMHLMSVDEQLPMLEPDVNEVTQVRWVHKVSTTHLTRVS
jgi:hypothetical protein